MDFSDIFPDLPCANKTVDTLHIDTECIMQMKRLGIEYIGDILEDWERVRDAGVGSPRFKWQCRCITYLYLDSIGCWPWPNDLERFKTD